MTATDTPKCAYPNCGLPEIAVQHSCDQRGGPSMGAFAAPCILQSGQRHGRSIDCHPFIPASSSPDTTPQPETEWISETAWLIELPQQMNGNSATWWTGRDVPDQWTTDPNDVVRFARKEDAERVRQLLSMRDLCTVTEHEWCERKSS